MYDYKKSKEIIESILKSPTKIVEKSNIPSTDSEFTYENGIKSWVGALFVDIVDSSKLFQTPNEDTARVIRSFCSEIISILKDDKNYREIGIRGDCVYCIYNAPYQTDLVDIFRHAYRINSFMGLFNKLLKKNGYSGTYDKTNESLVKDYFIPHYKDAVENAKVVYQRYVKKHHEEFGLDSAMPIWKWDASTTVFKLVEALKLST